MNMTRLINVCILFMYYFIFPRRDLITCNFAVTNVCPNNHSNILRGCDTIHLIERPEYEIRL